MPGTLTLDSITFATTADFTTAGKWLRTLAIGPREYEKAFPDSPGVDGTARKRFGFRQRRFHLGTTYVAADFNTTLGNIVTDFDTLANKSFSITIGGNTFPACELDTQSLISEPHPTGLPSGLFYGYASFVIVQKGLA